MEKQIYIILSLAPKSWQNRYSVSDPDSHNRIGEVKHSYVISCFNGCQNTKIKKENASVFCTFSQRLKWLMSYKKSFNYNYLVTIRSVCNIDSMSVYNSDRGSVLLWG